VSGLNCQAILRPIDAALEETSTGASHGHRHGRAPVHATEVHCVGGGHFSSDVTHCDVILLRGQ